MTEERDKALLQLREPFPEAVYGKLPRGNVQLDYVGHAAVTDRLLTIDPEWNWEPLALDELGLPVYDKAGGLWIKLTILGVTRLGYGDGADPKVRIGDALRNAAMRFGVALELWTKDELESTLEHPAPEGMGKPATNRRATGTVRRAPTQAPQADPETGEIATPAPTGKPGKLSNSTLREVANAMRHASVPGPEFLSKAVEIIGHGIGELGDMTEDEAKKVINQLDPL